MKPVGYILILIGILFMGLQWVAEWLAVDICLDAGEVYDYVTSSCRSDISKLPYTPHTERFGWQILASVFFAALGLVLVFIGRRRPR